VMDAINHAARSTVKAGLSAWIIFDQLQASSALIRPSSILAGMQTNTNVTAEQQAAIYALALQQLAIFGIQVRPNDIMISRESLDLVVHGDIFFRGTMIAQNAIFTPFVFLEDTQIAVGSHDWNAPGLAMVWATGVPSLEDWGGQMFQYQLVELSDGYQFRVNDIVSSGVRVSSLTLTVASMEKIGLMNFGISETAPIFSFSKPINIVAYMTAIVILSMILALFITIHYVPPGPRTYVVLAILVIGTLWWLIWTGVLAAWIRGLFDWIGGLFGGLKDFLWPF